MKPVKKCGNCDKLRLTKLKESVIMNEKELRFRQRYANFTKAYAQFQRALADYEKLTELEKEGFIQRYEYTFELAWKTLKDYLASQNIPVLYPREVIKAAFHHELIRDGELWMDMLEQRNVIAHTYDEVRFQKALVKIKDEYASALAEVYTELGAK